MNKFFWLITVSITSYLGFFRLKVNAVKEDLPLWRDSFFEKNVLIIGTGPSLDKLDENYLKKFDLVVYLNHAIKLEVLGDYDEFFFTTDIGVLRDILEKDYRKQIKRLGSKKVIVAPIFFQQVLFMEKEVLKLISLLKPNRSRFATEERKLKIGKYILKMAFPPSFWPVQPSKSDLNEWFNEKNQVQCFPVMETTSALSAILFVSKYKPKKIRLIGCDFGEGRSVNLVNSNPVNPIGAFEKSKEKFLWLKRYLIKKNIDVENDSWKK